MQKILGTVLVLFEVMQTSRGFIAVALIALTGCDAMKQMIDPSGNAYKKPGEAAKPAPATTNPSPSQPSKTSTPATPPTSTPVAAPVPAGRIETPIRVKASGRFLTPEATMAQLSEITFRAQGRNFQFKNALFRDSKGITSARDSSGKSWGLAIGDLNMDGSDDAVILLRTDLPEGTVLWDLTYLPNRSGRLYNVQTVALPSDQGVRDLVIEGSTIIVVPAIDGPNIHLVYSGGRLDFAKP